jgi:hypothetical protein
MTNSVHHETAQILQFPHGGRAGLIARERRFEVEKPKAMPTIVDYGSWYHDAAVREERDGPVKPHA